MKITPPADITDKKQWLLPMETYGTNGKVRVIHIMFNSRVSSQKLGATDTALCSPSLNKVKQNLMI